MGTSAVRRAAHHLPGAPEPSGSGGGAAYRNDRHAPGRGSAWWAVCAAWHAGAVTDFVTAGPAGWIDLPDVAEKLGVSISKVNQMIREGSLIAVKRDGVRRVPAELVANSTVLKHLPGVLTLLRDAGYNDEETLRWLYQPDPDLDGNAALGLGGPRAREVKRRAQALGF
ncbi:hypothetical protein GCM10012284_00070 [Mangrovihabitans endophyticus]|uniref:Rv2175c C-terminal domain-containing protein n=1 Tax=Mangrovihabitans endophyticus TaxID=1751298 RepID=A0A8J3BUI7_9ACTN|nr:hypothetical protein GCM10012284_00070 [Mangrovihabitans endophyticus]